MFVCLLLQRMCAVVQEIKSRCRFERNRTTLSYVEASSSFAAFRRHCLLFVLETVPGPSPAMPARSAMAAHTAIHHPLTPLKLRSGLSVGTMDELQIALAVLVLYFSYRYISNRSSSSTAASGSSGSTDRYSGLSARIPPASLEQLQALFPQLGERQLRWEVVRTGRIRSVEVIAQGMLEDQGRGRPLMPVSRQYTGELLAAIRSSPWQLCGALRG